jgi:hypothetical protein
LASALNEMENSPAEDTVVSALDDADQEGGFTVDQESAELGEARAAELDSKLDSFFDLDDEIEDEAAGNDEPAAETADEISLDQDDESVSALEGMGESEETDFAVPSVSLEDADDEDVFTDFFSSVEAEGDDGSLVLDQDAVLHEGDTESDVEETLELALDDDADQQADSEIDEIAIASPEQEGVGGEVVSAGLGEDRLAELDDKLDSFFEVEDEDAGETVEEIEPEQLIDDSSEVEEELLLEAEDEDVAADSLEGSDQPEEENEDLQLSEEMEIEQTETDSIAEPDEREEKLSSFFDTSEEGDEDNVVGQEETAEEPVEEVTGSSVTAIASLAAVAAGIAANPAPEVIQQVQELAAAGKEQEANTQQTVLLTLLDAAMNLIDQHGIEDSGSDLLIKELVGGLADADSPTTLINAVSHYTSWQQELFKKVAARSAAAPAVSAEEGSKTEAIARVQEEFSQLRAAMVEEFNAIRRELKKE